MRRLAIIHRPLSLALGDAQPDRDSVLDIATPLDKLIHVSLTDTAATCVDRFFKGNVRQMTHDRSVVSATAGRRRV